MKGVQDTCLATSSLKLTQNTKWGERKKTASGSAEALASPAPRPPPGAPDLSPRDASPGGPPAPDPAQPRLPGGLPLGFLSVLTGAGNDPLHLQSVCPLDPASKGQL